MKCLKDSHSFSSFQIENFTKKLLFLNYFLSKIFCLPKLKAEMSSSPCLPYNFSSSNKPSIVNFMKIPRNVQLYSIQASGSYSAQTVSPVVRMYSEIMNATRDIPNEI